MGGNAGVDAGERVTFDSHGETVVGRLFPAAIGDGPAPAVVIIGPENYQKEQAPMQYAPRLARLGYAALIFDPRCRGESGASRAATRTRPPSRRTCGPPWTT